MIADNRQVGMEKSKVLEEWKGKRAKREKKKIKSKEVFEVCDETPFLSRDDGE